MTTHPTALIARAPILALMPMSILTRKYLTFYIHQRLCVEWDLADSELSIFVAPSGKLL